MYKTFAGNVFRKKKRTIFFEIKFSERCHAFISHLFNHLIEKFKCFKQNQLEKNGLNQKNKASLISHRITMILNSMLLTLRFGKRSKRIYFITKPQTRILLMLMADRGEKRPNHLILIIFQRLLFLVNSFLEEFISNLSI